MSKQNTSHSRTQLDYYDQGAMDYEKERVFLTRGLNRASQRKASILAKICNENPIGAVIEVGAGSGLVSHFLAKKLLASKYVLMDLSKEMLAEAKARIADNRAQFVCGDIASTTFSDAQFEAIIGTDIIHHLEDPVLAMKEWLRIVKPGGRLAILETNAYNPLMVLQIGVEHEVRAFLNTDRNLRKWLEAAGWKNVRVVPSPSFTPAGPALLAPILNLIDQIFWRIPWLNRIAAVWLLTATRPGND